jgi:5'-nucleotidase
MGFAPESLYSPLKVNDDNTVGGFARIASIINAEKNSDKGITLVVDAGDFMMGTLFPGLEQKTGFQLRLMKDMGYDVAGLGNHEYEFGPEWLASMINTSAQKGKIPSLLIGNARFDKNDKRDDQLEKEVSDSLLSRTLVITREGIKVGFFSILGKNAVKVAPKAEPVTFEKQIAYEKKMVKELKSEKCNIIICISHSGISKDRKGKWGGEDVELAQSVKGIDIIIGGHSHTKLDQPVIIKGVPIVQTGEFGQYVGALSLSYDSEKLKIEGYRLIPVDDSVQGDKKTNSLIEEQKEKINLEILKPLGLDYNKPVAGTAFKIEGNDIGDYLNSNLGPFIADAIHYYVNEHNKKGTDMSMVAAGMIFDKIVPGIQTVPDIFRVMPLGSGSDEIPGDALSRLNMTGREVKSVLEILQIAGKSDPENYCYYSGIKVDFNPHKGLFKKIRKIEIIHTGGDAINVDFSKKNKALYSVTADSYMLEFIGIIKKMSLGLINVVPKDENGNRIKEMKTMVIDMDDNLNGIQEGKEWLALIEFLGSMTDTNTDGIPDIDKKYSVPVKCFFPVEY